MNDLVNFLQSDEAIMVYIIAAIISFIYIIYYYLRKTKIARLQRQNTMELNKIVSEVSDITLHEDKVSSSVSLNTEVREMPIVEENVGALPIEEVPPVVVTAPIEVIKEEPVVTEVITPSTDFQYQPVNMQVEGTVEVLETRNEVLEERIESVAPKTSKMEKNAKLDEVLKKIYPKERLEMVESLAEENPVEMPVINVDSLLAETIDDNQEEILYTNTVPDVEEAKKELEEVTRQLEHEENKAITLTEFEQLQEDTAIISLDELMKKAGTMYEVNEQVQYKDEGNEPISISDLEKRKEEMLAKNKEPELITTIEEKAVPKKGPGAIIMKSNNSKVFKSSKVISPVYGMKKSTELELENTANYEKLDEEIRKTNEFLATLKELQKKLD